MFQTVYLRISFIVVLCICTMSCDQEDVHLPYYTTPDFTPLFLNAKEADDQIHHAITNFSFTDQNGSSVSQKNIEGKIHVANFFFTTCGSICPCITANMQQVQSAFDKDSDVVFLSYSVTPWIDSVSQLRKYAKENKISSANWHLLTGDKAQIYNLARQSYFAEEEIGFTKDSSDFLHTEHVLLVDGQKRIRGIYNGTLLPDMEQLKQDILTLKKE